MKTPLAERVPLLGKSQDWGSWFYNYRALPIIRKVYVWELRLSVTQLLYVTVLKGVYVLARAVSLNTVPFR